MPPDDDRSAEPARGDAEVVLVDTNDEPIGTVAKLDAHLAPGRLHRAVSVFVYDTLGRLLLQRRAPGKYHFGGMWANTACSHPRPGEAPHAAATRRLAEEMGLRTPLERVGTFTYRAEDPASGLVEHELDHVFRGVTTDDPRPDLREADAWDWVFPDSLWDRLGADESGFVPWLRAALGHLPDLRHRT